MIMEFEHKPVMLFETVNSLEIKKDGIYVDGTVGGAGHSAQIAKQLENGKLFCLDRDPDAVQVATERLAGLPATVINGNYSEMDRLLANEGIYKVDGILLDLGVSSYQLDNAERGFSFHKDARLDMRMSRSGISAENVVNEYSVYDLTRIFREYGEEKFANRIANGIASYRAKEKITGTTQLAEIIASCVPAKSRRDAHPARRCFQAIRIEVNGELSHLSQALDKAFDLLNVGGVLSIITFHSLEDRMVKQRFADFCTGCTCPPDFPVCVCGKTPRGKLMFRKPVTASESELEENPRSRSAKLRSVMKIKE